MKLTKKERDDLILEIAKLLVNRISLIEIKKRLSDTIYKDISSKIDFQELTEDTVKHYKNANKVRLANQAQWSLYTTLRKYGERITRLELKK